MCNHKVLSSIPLVNLFQVPYLSPVLNTYTYVRITVYIFRVGKLPPTSNSESVSAQAKKELNSTVHKKLPAYCHWFALQVYDVYKSAQEQILQNEVNKVTLQLDGKKCNVEMSDLELGAKTINTVTSLHDIQGSLECRGMISDPR